MAKTEHKVGEVFQMGLKTIKCVRSNTCGDCIGKGEAGSERCRMVIEFCGPCGEGWREDRQNVSFIELKL